MKIDTTLNGDVLVLKPDGDIDLSNSGDFEQAFLRLLDQGTLKNILDFSAVKYIDSSGIGAIVRGHRHLKEKGGEIVLACCNDNLKKIFKLINFHRYFKMVQTVAEAYPG